MLRPGEVLIHDGNYQQFLAAPPGQGMGLVPRDFSKVPCGSMAYAPQATLTKIPREKWPDMIRAMEQTRSRLSDLRDIGTPEGNPIPSRDQNGRGYCWAHSTVSAAILSRARDHTPYADLSAYAIACIIKGYRDEGGWNAQSMEFLAERGCPTSDHWPQRSVSRSNDNPATWENAKLYRDTEWADIPEGDFDLQISYLLHRFPHPLDLNWWSHSVCAADPVNGVSTWGQVRMESGKLAAFQEFNEIWDMEAGGFGIRIWNSWGDSWSANGMGVLTESRARNNGAIALLSMRAT